MGTRDSYGPRVRSGWAVKALVTLLVIGAVAGCAGNGLYSEPYSPNASSSDCAAAGGATYDSDSRVCIGAQR